MHRVTERIVVFFLNTVCNVGWKFDAGFTKWCMSFVVVWLTGGGFVRWLMSFVVVWLLVCGFIRWCVSSVIVCLIVCTFIGDTCSFVIVWLTGCGFTKWCVSSMIVWLMTKTDCGCLSTFVYFVLVYRFRRSCNALQCYYTDSSVKRTAFYPWKSCAIDLVKLGETWTRGFWDMRADRQTNQQTNKQTDIQTCRSQYNAPLLWAK